MTLVDVGLTSVILGILHGLIAGASVGALEGARVGLYTSLLVFTLFVAYAVRMIVPAVIGALFQAFAQVMSDGINTSGADPRMRGSIMKGAFVGAAIGMAGNIAYPGTFTSVLSMATELIDTLFIAGDEVNAALIVRNMLETGSLALAGTWLGQTIAYPISDEAVAQFVSMFVGVELAAFAAMGAHILELTELMDSLEE